MLVSQFTYALADELNDLEPGYEYTRWPLQTLYTYIQQALQQIKLLEPDLFVVSKNIVLREGTIQQLPSQYGDLLDIYGLTKGDYELLKYFRKPNYCLDDYTPSSYSLNSQNNRIFYIYPPVPAGSTVTISALVTQTIPTIVSQTQDISLPGGDIDKYFNQVIDWGLYRAFLKDTESQSNKERAQMHYKSFYDAFGAQTKILQQENLERAATGEDVSNG